jgi:two-component system alkaline phosphatase synthesis response regulator PhoP
MERRQILVVEDDPAIREGVADALRFAGFTPLECARGDDGLELALREDVDLLLLDLVLPGLDGLDILRAVRRDRATLPVIILTARGSEKERVEGLKLGADDYVVKPFSVQELLARIQAVLRRSPERPLDLEEVEIPGGRIDFSRREVRFGDGARSVLSERETELLLYLARHGGRAISRDEILARVWHLRPENVKTRTIDMHVRRLREKLRDDPADPSVVLTVRGRGYMFDQRTEDA